MEGSVTVTLDTFATATAMLRALRGREISAVELLEMHLAQIARRNPALNAIVTPDYDNARQTAEQADMARASGADDALLGLPLTIKDCIDVAALPGTAGVPEFAERRPERDAPVVARVRAAGAAIMGKTNVPPWAGDWQADNPIFGCTNNPWDLERTPGGSTGGGAAALAAGMTPLEFGSDIGGSIRVPAAFCGVYGHRPSDSAVPSSGHYPGTPLPNAAVIMGVQGPLARSAEDLILAFDVVAGPDVGEDAGYRLALPPARHERLADFRIAVLPPIDWSPVDAEIMAAQDALATRLRGLGARVEQVAPDFDLREYHRLYRSFLSVIDTLGMSPEERQHEATTMRVTGDEFEIASANGMTATAADFITWFGQRERYRAAYRSFFQSWDVLITPTFVTPAFRHKTGPLPGRTFDINGHSVSYARGLVYPAFATLAGHPATAFPIGQTQAGLPIGVQAIGPYLGDYTPMRFAALVAEEWGGFVPPPAYRE
jgi:amidase